jgi:5'(3')-deoxyribonucleotidase
MKVYIDLDGVLADFRKGIIDWFGDIEPHYDEMVDTNFFETLDKFPTSDQLIDIVVAIFGKYSICSMPLRGDHDNSAYHKTRWVEQQLSPQPEEIIITKRKEKYAKGNILIDDKESNVDGFNKNGGYGILYKAWEHDLNYLMSELHRVADEINHGHRQI